MNRIFQQVVSLIFYSNFFIAACAAILVYETGTIFKLSPDIDWFSLLVFLCTVNIYGLHYYLKSLKPGDDTRMLWCRKNSFLIKSILIVFTIAIAYLAYTHSQILFSSNNLLWSLLIPILSIAYSFPFLPGRRALRHIGWLKLPLLAFVWSFVTVGLPVLYAGKTNLSQAWVLFANRYFFIMALAMLFNLRDYEEDKKENIFTPAVVMGPAKILSTGKWMICILNMITTLLLIRVFQFQWPVQIIALFIPVILLFLLFHYFRSDKNEIRFSLLHDGLMPVKALLLIFAAGFPY